MDICYAVRVYEREPSVLCYILWFGGDSRYIFLLREMYARVSDGVFIS